MLFSEINNPKLEIIAGTECIGDSLYKINTNTINLSSYVIGIQADVSQTWYRLQTDVGNANSILAKIQSLSSQTTQWDTVYTFIQQSSSYIFEGYDAAINAIPKSTLSPLSALIGSNSRFTSMSAVNLTAATINSTNTTADYLFSRSSRMDTLTANYFYGNGSKLTGIIAPTRVYVRFRGNTVNLPDSTFLPAGYLGVNYNVSSVAKIGTGTYQINYATAIESPDYAYFMSSGGGFDTYVACRAPNTNATTYSITVVNKRLSDNATVDAEEVCVAVMYPQPT